MNKKRDSNLIIGNYWIREAIDALCMILHSVDKRERIILGKHEGTRHSDLNLQKNWIKRYPEIQKEFPILAKEIRNRTISYNNFLLQLLDLELLDLELLDLEDK